MLTNQARFSSLPSLVLALLWGCAHAPVTEPRVVAQVVRATLAVAPARAPTSAAKEEGPAPHLRRPVQGQAAPHEAPSRLVDPALTNTVTLTEILAYADHHSRLLRVARATRSRFAAARVAADVGSSSNPELTLALGPRLGEGVSLDGEVTLMQALRVAGERDALHGLAEHTQQLTTAQIEEVRWAVHCEVHAVFHDAMIARERQQLSERVVKFQQSVLSSVERQTAAGEVAPLILRLAQAEVAQAQQVQIAAEQNYLAARIRLAQLSGWPVDKPPEPGGVIETPRAPPPLSRLLEEAQQHLPSLRTHSARVQEAQARAVVAERQGGWRPALGVRYQYEGSRAGAPADNVIMGVVSLPIPSWQRNQAEQARVRSEVLVAEAESLAARDQLHGAIAEAHSAVVAAAKRSSVYGTEIVPRFEENLSLLGRSFELGEIDILALSTGRERFLRIQSDALAAQQDYFNALAGLERVVGVDLWHDEHAEPQP